MNEGYPISWQSQTGSESNFQVLKGILVTMCLLHLCYLEALYEHTLSSREQGAGRKIDFVKDFSILKCGFVAIRNHCQKTNQQGDSLQGNSCPKAVLLEVSLTEWTGKLWGPWSNHLPEELPHITNYEQPTSPISWAVDLAGEKRDSKGPLESFLSWGFTDLNAIQRIHYPG